MDQQTRRELKQDHFVTTSGNGLEWASENRRSVIVTASILLAAIILVVLIGVFFNHRADAAADAFGNAMQTYQTSLAIPGQPTLPGEKTFPDAKARATAANAQFRAVADKYSLLDEGRNALYFVGITQIEEGQTASAEGTLRKVASGWNRNLSALANLALADLYHQSGRDGQAIDLYNQLTAKPTDAVPAGLAQIQLAELYTAEGKVDQAHKIYAQLKDKDSKGAAGVVAAQKLNPSAPPAQPGL